MSQLYLVSMSQPSQAQSGTDSHVGLERSQWKTIFRSLLGAGSDSLSSLLSPYLPEDQKAFPKFFWLKKENHLERKDLLFFKPDFWALSRENLILWAWSRTWRDSVFNNHFRWFYQGILRNGTQAETQTYLLKSRLRLPASHPKIRLEWVLKATTDWTSNSELRQTLTLTCTRKAGIWKDLCKPGSSVVEVAKSSVCGQKHQLWKWRAVAHVFWVGFIHWD